MGILFGESQNQNQQQQSEDKAKLTTHHPSDPVEQAAKEARHSTEGDAENWADRVAIGIDNAGDRLRESGHLIADRLREAMPSFGGGEREEEARGAAAINEERPKLADTVATEKGIEVVEQSGDEAAIEGSELTRMAEGEEAKAVETEAKGLLQSAYEAVAGILPSAAKDSTEEDKKLEETTDQGLQKVEEHAGGENRDESEKKTATTESIEGGEEKAAGEEPAAPPKGFLGSAYESMADTARDVKDAYFDRLKAGEEAAERHEPAPSQRIEGGQQPERELIDSSEKAKAGEIEKNKGRAEEHNEELKQRGEQDEVVPDTGKGIVGSAFEKLGEKVQYVKEAIIEGFNDAVPIDYESKEAWAGMPRKAHGEEEEESPAEQQQQQSLGEHPGEHPPMDEQQAEGGEQQPKLEPEEGQQGESGAADAKPGEDEKQDELKQREVEQVVETAAEAQPGQQPGAEEANKAQAEEEGGEDYHRQQVEQMADVAKNLQLQNGQQQQSAEGNENEEVKEGKVAGELLQQSPPAQPEQEQEEQPKKEEMGGNGGEQSVIPPPPDDMVKTDEDDKDFPMPLPPEEEKDQGDNREGPKEDRADPDADLAPPLRPAEP